MVRRRRKLAMAILGGQDINNLSWTPSETSVVSEESIPDSLLSNSEDSYKTPESADSALR